MTGYRPNKKALVAEDLRKLADDLNCFYTPFDNTDCSAEREGGQKEGFDGEKDESAL